MSKRPQDTSAEEPDGGNPHIRFRGGPRQGDRPGLLNILESAALQIRTGQSAAFELAFREAQAIIASMPGYISHELQRCLEREDHYLLLVRWETVAAHEEGFRKSARYQDWKKLLHQFYDPFPTVLHYESVLGSGIGN